MVTDFKAWLVRMWDEAPSTCEIEASRFSTSLDGYVFVRGGSGTFKVWTDLSWKHYGVDAGGALSLQHGWENFVTWEGS